MHLRAWALAAIALLVPAGAHAASGPGRLTLDLGGTEPHASVDPTGFEASAATPDGGAVLASGLGTDRVHLVAVRRDGRPDPSFGSGGTLDVYPPPDPTRAMAVEQLLRRPDGRLVLVTETAATTAQGLPRLAVTGLTATGAPDPTFDAGQSLVLDVGPSGHEQASLAPDGGVVLTGDFLAAGAQPGADDRVPSTWIAQRVSPDGTLDTGFGTSGTATVLPAISGGRAAAVAPDGSIWALGVDDKTPVLRRLTATGQPDPSFPETPLSPSGAYDVSLLARADGTADVLAGSGTTALLTRYAPDGTGTLSIPAAKGSFSTELLAGADGVDIVLAPSWEGFGTGHGTIREQLISPTGAITLDTTTDAGLAGGLASIFAKLRAPGPTTISQHSGGLATALARPDGSVLLGGSVAAAVPRGEGSGDEHDQGALVSLAPDGTLDGGFGGPTLAAHLTLKLIPQRFKTDKKSDRLGVRIATTTSDVGLVHLVVRHGGTVIADSTAPSFTTVKLTQRAYLTTAGRKLSSSHEDLHVTVSATFRDLLGQDATAKTTGTLK